MNVQNPAYYFNQGFNAAAEGLLIESNPYLFDAWPYKCWNLGFNYNLACEEAISFEPEGQLARVEKPPFEQGRVAMKKGIAFYDCPYEPGTKSALQWEAGWVDMVEATPADNRHWHILGALTIVVIGLLLWARYINHL